MEENKLVKKEFIILMVCVILLITLFIGFSFSYFLSVDKGKDNVISIGDLNVSFCEDETCKKNYPNFGQVIGTKIVDGQSVIESIYPYQTNEEALLNHPYIFNIKNTGSLKTNVTIRLIEDKDYKLSDKYENYVSLSDLYANNIMIGISYCNDVIDRENVIIKSYGELTDNVILENEEFNSNDEKTYCLWTWLNNETPNEVQNSYFVANLSFKAEYKPNN